MERDRTATHTHRSELPCGDGALARTHPERLVVHEMAMDAIANFSGKASAVDGLGSRESFCGIDFTLHCFGATYLHVVLAGCIDSSWLRWLADFMELFKLNGCVFICFF